MNDQNIEEARAKSGLPANECELTKYGIRRIPVDYFHYRGFRYTNPKDAVAQAERDAISA